MTEKLVLKLAAYSRKFPNHPKLENVLRGASRLVSEIGGWWYREHFDEAKSFCLFIGHGRSGHSLIGALLDAHPDIVVAHELNALNFVKNRISASKRQLFYFLLSKSRLFKQKGATGSGYKYDVPSQHQGNFESIHVIGDKKGGGTSDLLGREPKLLRKLYEMLGIKINIIHIVRHPLDNIAATSEEIYNGSVKEGIRQYFRRCDSVIDILDKYGDKKWVSYLTVKHENIVRETGKNLDSILNFLDVSYEEEYIEACSKVVFNEVSESRGKVEFRKDDIKFINKKTLEYPFLEGYEILYQK
ncbi:hypothetical protein GGP66_000223 [Salinibacter ruber]|uniref:sulfotransferase n=1 Tax=Salinibacter ruber TaxID=146919 RepID=UPI00216885A5|nr:sulfotransferase [Salinibacter ruber]MCS3672819.1 hypothetical protein [Salinibacter ruber]